MKQLLPAILCSFILTHASSQNYLRGVVNDEKGNGLYNVQIHLHSKGTTPYYTGASGAFGIPVSVLQDTITLQFEGYETLVATVFAAKYQVLVLKLLTSSVSVTKHKLISFVKDEDNEQKSLSYSGNESYSDLVENNFINADKFPETGFVMNVDRASYSNIRRFINTGSKVPADAVRIEEIMNYFSISLFKDEVPQHIFTCKSQVTSCPWNNSNQLLYINLVAPSLSFDSVPPCNLIFLIDVSGSMDEPNRLPMLKDAFKLLVKNLRAKDSVAIVVYGGNVGIMLQPTSGNEKNKIDSAIEKLYPGGETPGEAAILTAYSLAERAFNKDGNNRIILATDGDFNVGQTSDKDLEDLITKQRQSGIYLTCLGVGMGNYKDSKLETLAKKGNGNFAYIDNLNEAEKVLVTEFTKTLYAVAHNAFAGIVFNPNTVKRYRLIGFDNKGDALADSTSQLEGGEVGTSHSLIAVFEIEPAEKNISDSNVNTFDKNIANLTVHYQLPENKTDLTQAFQLQNNFENIKDADPGLRFVASLIMFGENLKQSDISKKYSWDDVIKLASTSAKTTDYSQAEFLTLLEKARKLYGSKKDRRKKQTVD